MIEDLTEEQAKESILKALARIRDEKLDINYFEPGTFVNGECWVALDRDMCTVAIDTSLSGMMVKLANNDQSGLE